MSNYRRVFEQNTTIFITMVTEGRKLLLIKNIDLLRKAFENSKKFYNYEVFAAVILPDHMHLLIKPQDIKDYPKIVSRIKHYFSRNFEYKNDSLSQSKISKREKGVWQRRFIEHTIRDEEDLYNHLNYIHYNPVKHGLVKNVRDWEYSSFQKFVEMKWYEDNWGSTNDIKGLEDLKIVGYD